MRSLLYCPADNPSMMVQAPIYGADAVIYDLEDAVSPEDKDEARILLSQMLESYEFGELPVIVRINGIDTPWWQDDLKAVISQGKPVVIRVPKAEDTSQVESVSVYLERLESERGLTPGSISLHLLIETPIGIEHAFELAGCSTRIRALGFGAEDYCRVTGIRRRGPLYALDFVRSRLVNAAAAYGLEFHDCAYGLIEDLSGLEEEALRARALGADGKSVVHPRQIGTVNRIFSPSEEDISWAQKVLEQAEGGVSSVGGQMIDAPVIAQAERILATVKMIEK